MYRSRLTPPNLKEPGSGLEPQRRPLTRPKHGREPPPLLGERGMPHGIHPTLNPVQPAAPHPSAHPISPQAQHRQLLARHEPMLAGRERGERLIEGGWMR